MRGQSNAINANYMYLRKQTCDVAAD